MRYLYILKIFQTQPIDTTDTTYTFIYFVIYKRYVGLRA